MILEHKKEVKKSTKIILAVLLLLLAVGGYFGLNIYKTYLAGNVTGNEKYIYIKTGANYDEFLSNLASKEILKDINTFKAAAGKMSLANALKPGRYAVKLGMNNRTLINKLKSGNQDAVNLKFQNIRKKENFAAYLAKNMEADSLSFIKVLDSAALVEKHGFNTDTFIRCLSPTPMRCIGTAVQKIFLTRC
jgi:UPF0755 protein